MPFLIPEGIEAAEAFSAVSATAAVAGTGLAYNASMDQARQSKMNAQAQANTMALEAQRQALETQQAQMRTAQNQQRFRAQQEVALSGNGLLGTTGNALDIMADTYTSQQRELKDIGYRGATNTWGLQNAATSAIAEGNSQAGAIMGQAGGTLLTNVGNTANQGYRTYKGY